MRAIYEGYAAWFDGDPASMYAEPAAVAYPDLVTLAGGAGPIVARAQVLLEAGDAVRVFRLVDVALVAEPRDRGALETRLVVLQRLAETSRNFMEPGWLRHAIRETTDRFERLPARADADPTAGTSPSRSALPPSGSCRAAR